MELIGILSAADRLAVICEGEEFPVPASSDAAFRERFLALTEGGYEMPAFGVSLDKVVKEALKEGLWLKFYYSETKSYLEMPFDALAVRLEPDMLWLEPLVMLPTSPTRLGSLCESWSEMPRSIRLLMRISDCASSLE